MVPFVFQMHYTPTGSAEQDLTKLGIVFADESDVTHEVFTIAGIDQEFEIPPRAKSHPVQAAVFFPKNGKLLSVSPHMHLRGQSFVLRGRSQQEKQKQVLVEVPRYDFNWQHIYVLAKPLELSQMQEIDFTVTFNNSASNPVNPDPDQHVCWGDQTWEEMAVAFFEVSQPRPGSEPAPRGPITARKNSSADAADKKRRARAIDEFVKKFLADLDTNRDRKVHYDEVPLVVRRFGTFGRFNRNGDEWITVDEIRETARQIVR